MKFLETLFLLVGITPPGEKSRERQQRPRPERRPIPGDEKAHNAPHSDRQESDPRATPENDRQS